MSNGKWLNNIGRVIKNKKGGYFLVFERQKDKNKKPKGDNCFPLTINEGDVFQMKLKKDDLQKLVDDGGMSQETADSICETVKFEISKAPARDGKPNKSDDSDGVNF